jgi:preprotein translocase subunit SecB
LSDLIHKKYVFTKLLLTKKNATKPKHFSDQIRGGWYFEAKGFMPEEETLLLRGHAISQIYLYSSARVNGLLIHADFPPINMKPIDFVAYASNNS